jgi:hypothetical protein
VFRIENKLFIAFIVFEFLLSSLESHSGQTLADRSLQECLVLCFLHVFLLLFPADRKNVVVIDVH